MIPGTWEPTAEDPNDLLLLTLGRKIYGARPIDFLPEIRQSKIGDAEFIKKSLNISNSDTVVDLGSGCGFIAKEIAKYADKIHCLDISNKFLNFCASELSNVDNAEFHLITHANLSMLDVSSIDKVYSSAVFIHFNLYDIFLYLKSMLPVLKPNGEVFFNIMSSESIDINSFIWKRNIELYSLDRMYIFNNVIFNDVPVVCNIAVQLGYELLSVSPDIESTWIHLRKK